MVSETIIQTVLGLKRGTHLVIPVDGPPRLVNEKPTIPKAYKEISTPDRECVCVDTITLRMAGAGHAKDPIVMLVDDTGMLDGLPANDVAFYIAHEVKHYPHLIHGTVVIVNDADFIS